MAADDTQVSTSRGLPGADATLATGAGATAADEDALPLRIGPYRLVEKLGEGGFGTVYVAEQEQPVQRRVALKILKAGMDTRQVVARFEAERQALALMDHPHIARVYDAGATPAGRPYFVMELVPGVPVNAFCDEQRLAIPERLALFIEICHAIQHAHLKGVIHRDIKPSNLLVSLHDGRPSPKIIDFGVAKATDRRLGAESVQTEMNQFIGTPDYMSPEQAGVGGLDVDTRSDIYSLGVVLYELLVGVLPFDREELRSGGFEAMMQRIRQTEPPKPSARLSTIYRPRTPSPRSAALRPALPGTPASDAAKPVAGRDPSPAATPAPADLARARRVDTAALQRTLRGDLDWITMKAIDKDRTRRYETANGLALDVQRYLNNEPVLAGPPGVGYKLAKFAKRNRGLFVGGALVATALLVGLALATVGFVRARADRDRARHAEQLAGDRLRETVAARDAETAARLEAQRQSYVANVSAADACLRTRAVGEARRRLEMCDESLRGWEWRHLVLRTDSSLQTLRNAPPMPVRAAFARDETAVAAIGRTAGYTEWDLASGAILAAVPPSDDAISVTLASSDATRAVVLATDSRARAPLARDYLLWDAPRGVSLGPLRAAGRPRGPLTFAFSGDSSVLLMCDDATYYFFDARSGAPLRRLTPRPATPTILFSPVLTRPSSIALSTDATRIAEVTSAGIHIRDAESGAILQTVRSMRDRYAAPQFSADGSRLAAAITRTPLVRVFDVAAGDALFTLSDPNVTGGAFAFSTDGALLASGAALYDAATGQLQASLGGHDGRPIGHAFAATDGRMLSFAFDGTIRVWDPEFVAGVRTLSSEDVRALAWAPDGQHVLTVSGGTRSAGPDDDYPPAALRFWDARSGALRNAVRPLGDNPADVAWSPAGDLVAVAYGELIGGRVVLLDAASGERVAQLAEAAPRRIVFDRTGQRLLVVAARTSLSAWDVRTRQRLWALPANDARAFIGGAAFSPDGRQIAVTRMMRVEVLDAASGESLRTGPHAPSQGGVAYSPDGLLLACASPARGALLLDAQQLTPTRTLFGRGDVVTRLQFTPDGRRLLGQSDGTLLMWDTQTGELVYAPTIDDLAACDISPDGTRLLVGAGRLVTIWETERATRFDPQWQVHAALRRRAQTLVDRLLDELVLPDDVQQRLRDDSSLSDDVRDRALRLADLRGPDPTQLNQRAWRIVRDPGADPKEYQRALQYAQAALRHAPERELGYWLNTLGAAQYRIGEYEAAIETFARSDNLNQTRHEGGHPADIAFTAMALHQLERHAEARALLPRLHALTQTRRWIRDAESQNLLREVEDLLDAHDAADPPPVEPAPQADVPPPAAAPLPPTGAPPPIATPPPPPATTPRSPPNPAPRSPGDD